MKSEDRTKCGIQATKTSYNKCSVDCIGITMTTEKLIDRYEPVVERYQRAKRT